MMALLLLTIYLAAGLLICRWLLPRQSPVARAWLGLSLGLFLMMWLPALIAFLRPFDALTQALSLAPLALLTLIAWLLRSREAVRPWSDKDRQALKLLLTVALPLSLMGLYLLYTHSLRPAEGALRTGQATYGDFPLHLSIITSLPGKTLPMDYSILPGVRLGYPFLANSLSTSLLVLGLPLRWSVILPGVLMMGLVFSGFLLLALRACKKPGAAVLATLLVFVNGGLGFLYAFDMQGTPLGSPGSNQLQQGAWLERVGNILNGWYQTPANHAEFARYNLRWSNILVDMLLPQRTFLAGWAVLLPCLYLLLDQMKEEAWDRRQTLLLGVLAGGLPLIHTHSFLALGLMSAGFLAHGLLKKRALKPWLLYGGIAVLLALPQLVAFTFSQSGGEGFLRFQFNWVNNPGGQGLRDSYLWFYVKNIGLPFLLMIFVLFEKNPWHRRLFAGAFVIFLVAEFILFQPNEYDNNKLFYVWWAVCALPVSDYAFTLWGRLKGLKARPAIAAFVLFAMFFTGSLAIAREAVSDYQLFSEADVRLADFIRDETPQDSRFITATQHNNPVFALAGREVVCGPDLWLYYHGFDTRERQRDLKDFYMAPEMHLDVLERYGVSHVLAGSHEREWGADASRLEELLQKVYDAGGYQVFEVPGRD